MTFTSELLGLKINNKLCDARSEYVGADNVESITLESEDGYFIYRRTLFLVLTTAFCRLFPDYRLKLHRSINKSTYCRVYSDVLFDSRHISRMRAEMDKIIAADMIIKEKDGKYTIDTEFMDFGGPLAAHTGVLHKYDIAEREGGFVLLYPNNRTNGLVSPYSSSEHLMKAIDEYSLWSDILNINEVCDINRIIANGKSSDMINVQEALHDKKISEIANRIKLLQPNVKAILISGPSSSGKTTFSRKLAVNLRVNGMKPVNISLDNYYHNRDKTPRHADGSYNFEDLEAIDYELFNSHLAALIRGEEIEAPVFDFQLSRRADIGHRVKLEEGGVVIIEGIHALNERLTYSIESKNKFKIYCSPLADLNISDIYPVAASDVRLVRRIVRDNLFRNSDAERTLSMWKSVQDGEIKNVFRYNETADCIFNTAIIYECSVFKPFIEPLLNAMTQNSVYYPQAQRLFDLFSHFEPMDSYFVPSTSLLREFIGGSSYHGA